MAQERGSLVDPSGQSRRDREEEGRKCWEGGWCEQSQRQEVQRELSKRWVAPWGGLCEWSEKVP